MMSLAYPVRAVAVICVIAFLTYLNMLPAAAEEYVRPSRTVATYGNWSIACNVATVSSGGGDAKTEELCELMSRVNFRGEDGVTRPLLLVAVGRLPGQSAPRILFQVPGNAYLRSPVSLVLDPEAGQAASSVPEMAINATFMRCDAGRCVADANLSDENQARLSEAKSAIVSYVNVSGKRIGVPLSMIGHKNAALELEFK